MSLKLENWIVEETEHDFEIFDFIIENNFELNICTLGIPEINDLEMLEEIMTVTRSMHPEIFGIAFEVWWCKKCLLEHREREREKLEKELVLCSQVLSLAI